jgi:hypothetical protein
MTNAIAQLLAERHPDDIEPTRWVPAAALEAEPDLEPRVDRGWDAIGLRHTGEGSRSGRLGLSDEG